MKDIAAGLARDLATALAFLTRLPAGAAADRAGPLSRVVWAFPLVGAALGVGAAVVLSAALWLGVPAYAAALLAVGAIVLATGALHEDGLADTADGLGLANRERALAVMREGPVGAWGVVALIFSIGLRTLALADLALYAPVLAGAALVASAAASRALLAPAMALVPPARADGLGADAGAPDRAAAWRAAGIGAGLAALFLIGHIGLGVVVVLALASVAAALVLAVAKRRFGGHTGDVLGAAQQAAETAALLATAAIAAGGIA
ncbi:MAG: adenosylcobinamide-GDP ribazoletransferase [Alphaproteobacteria bacterium]